MFPDELVVIGVHSAKFPSEQLTQNIRQAVMRHGIEHPVVNDAGFKVWNAYTVRAWPTLVLIDPTGRIAGEVSGEINADEFAKNIRELIEQNPEGIDTTPLALVPESAREPERALNYPAKLLVDGDRLFISDTGHHRILEVQLNADGLGGELSRVFGSGEAGFRDGPPVVAAFHHPHGLSVLNDTLYVADTENHALRAVDLHSGSVRTLAGTGQKGQGRSPVSSPLDTALRSPWDVLAMEKYLFIAMAGSHQIWVLIGESRLGPFAGNGSEALVDGPLGQSSFNQPSGLSFGMGYLFVADPEASAVRAVSLAENPQVLTLVGQGLFDFGDQDGSTDMAMLQHPAGLSFADQKVYIADSYNHKVKLLSPLSGQVVTLAGSGQPGMRDGTFLEAEFFEPEGIWAQGNRLYVADTNNHQVRVLDLEQGLVHTFRLSGLERLPAPRIEAQDEVVLRTMEVSSGLVYITLDVYLPGGYKLNPDAPCVVRVCAPDGGDEVKHTFAPGDPLFWTQQVQGNTSLALELTLYYCDEGDTRLCMIHDRRFHISLSVVTDGPNEVRIPYQLPIEG